MSRRLIHRYCYGHPCRCGWHILCLFLVGCGGDPFVGALGAPGETWEGGADGLSPVPLDAPHPLPALARGLGAVADAASPESAPPSGDALPDNAMHDVGELAESDAGDADSASRVDTGTLDDAGDAGASSIDSPAMVDRPAPPPPPPALCCNTPCGGIQVAAITCDNGPAWTCDDQGGASCSAVTCAVGSACHWQGMTCAGLVRACP